MSDAGPDAATPDHASSAAALDALVDDQPLVLFAWLTNRQHPWLGPFADEASRWADCDRVQMGYTALWFLRRVGVWDGTWRWDAGSVVRQGNPELVAFERTGSSYAWRGSRFEGPDVTLVDGRAPGQALALCVLEQTHNWH